MKNKNNIIVRIKTPMNRSDKRKVGQEFEKIKSWYEDYVVPMEVAFFRTINNATEPYQDIFDEFECQYLRAISRLTIQTKLHFLGVNRNYFKKLYEPIEKEKY